jgi:Icc-related predicted phosphoesterase
MIKPSVFILFAMLSAFNKSTGAERSTGSLDVDLRSQNDRSSVIFIGDLQRTGFWERVLLREQNDNERQAVIQAVSSENPAFLVILGDLVSTGGKKSAWDYFDACTQPLRQRRIPLIAVPGNHDYFGGTKNAMDHFCSHFPRLEGPTWTSARLKGLAFILLNSNYDRMSQVEIDSQEIWYSRMLDEFQNDSTISIIVVGCHHPPFTNSTIVSESKDVQSRFVPAFVNTPKAKLFISGHCHSYERFIEYGKTFVVSGGAGGPRQKVIVNPKKQRHPDLYDGPAIRPFYYCKMLMEKDRIVVQMIKLDESSSTWSVGDTISIQFN